MNTVVSVIVYPLLALGVALLLKFWVIPHFKTKREFRKLSKVLREIGSRNPEVQSELNDAADGLDEVRRGMRMFDKEEDDE